MTKASSRKIGSWIQTNSDQDGPNIWSWITSHRTGSDLQKQHDTDKEQPQLETYNRKMKPSLGQDASKEDLSGIDNGDDNAGKGKGTEAPLTRAQNDDATETEKKSAQSAWEQSQLSQAFDLTERDAVALMIITVVAMGVRFWRISWPDEVVYFTGEYAFDAHPPLGTVIMAGVAALSNYNGAFGSNNVGE
ncbi:Protein O-mannosyl-transferase 1 [Mortierella sp. AD094]|nr:Protein O-mannosyl-transferase 1 [Mortierella sp. AD094]